MCLGSKEQVLPVIGSSTSYTPGESALSERSMETALAKGQIHFIEEQRHAL